MNVPTPTTPTTHTIEIPYGTHIHDDRGHQYGIHPQDLLYAANKKMYDCNGSSISNVSLINKGEHFFQFVCMYRNTIKENGFDPSKVTNIFREISDKLGYQVTSSLGICKNFTIATIDTIFGTFETSMQSNSSNTMICPFHLTSMTTQYCSSILNGDITLNNQTNQKILKLSMLRFHLLALHEFPGSPNLDGISPHVITDFLFGIPAVVKNDIDRNATWPVKPKGTK